MIACTVCGADVHPSDLHELAPDSEYEACGDCCPWCRNGALHSLPGPHRDEMGFAGHGVLSQAQSARGEARGEGTRG